MENSKQCLKSATQYYLLYIFIALLATPVVIYSFSFCAEKYLLGNDVSFETIMNSSTLDNASLIIGNLLIIVVFIKRKYIRLTISKNLRAEISRDKKLYLWAILLKLSSLWPINLFCGFSRFKRLQCSQLQQYAKHCRHFRNMPAITEVATSWFAF